MSRQLARITCPTLVCVGPTVELLLAPLLVQMQEALGMPAFHAAEAAGRALSYDEIMAEARMWLGDRAAAQSATTIDDPPSS